MTASDDGPRRVDAVATAAGALKGRIPPSETLRARARADERRAIARREKRMRRPT